MRDAAQHDAWQAGDSYDNYMGRWSRQIAPKFLAWLNPGTELDWVEIGCGTGALSGFILTQCDPRSLTSIDPSEGFLMKARETVANDRVIFRQGNAQALDLNDATADVVVSGLVLNFVPDRDKALSEMKRVARTGATVAFYVWDYPGGGIEFMRAFWTAAKSLDPKAVELSEDRRFPFCNPDELLELARTAELSSVECVKIEQESVFTDFEDYWNPFTLGAGPAPGYYVSLDPVARDALRSKLRDTLPYSPDGSIHMNTRAWAVRGIA